MNVEPALEDGAAYPRSTDGEGAGGKSTWPLWLSLGFAASLVVLYFAWPAFRESANEGFQALMSEDRRRVSDWVEQFGAWGPVVVMAAMTAQMFFIVVPSVVLLAVSVLAYGALGGALLGIGSVLLASSVGYWVGVGLGPVTVDRVIGGKKRKSLEEYVDRYGSWTVVVFRMSPVLSNDAISFVGGLLKMRFLRFLGATAIGVLPLVVLIAYLGESTAQMRTTLLWVSGVNAAALVAYILYDRRHRVGGSS